MAGAYLKRRRGIPSIKLGLVGVLIGLAIVALGLLPDSTAHAQTPAANDNFASATAISGASGTISGTALDATAETGDPAFHNAYTGWADDLNSLSIWYAWTAPQGVGPTTFVVTGTGDPWGGTAYYSLPVLGVYTGSLGSLDEVAYNQRSETGQTFQRAQVQFTPTAGVTYHLGVGDYQGRAPINLSWASSNPPANDNFANAAPLTDGVTGSTVEATYEVGELANYYENSDLGGRSVWYTYTPTETAVTVISLEGSDYDTVLGVYTGSLGTLTEVAYNDDTPIGDGTWSRVTFLAQAGTTYHIGIGGPGGVSVDWGQVLFWGISGNYTAHILPGAPNDNFANATTLSGASGTQSATIDASAEAGDPKFHTTYLDSTDDFYGHSIWYRWTAPEGAGATAFTLNGDGVLGVYTGSLGALSEVGYNQYSSLNNESSRAQVVFTPTPGQTYSIGVGSNGTAPISLSWAPAPDGPSNDNFANSLPLPAEVTGDNIAATFEAGEPTVQEGAWGAASDLGRSVWYVYTPGTSGPVTITLAGSSYDTVLGVYTGSLGSLNEIAYNDDYTDVASRVTFDAVAGTTYHVGIGGCCGAYPDGGQVMEWGDSGTYFLQSFGPGLGVSNDNFADARAISGATGSRLGNTEDTTPEAGDPKLHPSYANPDDLLGRSIWYAWTAPEGVGPTTLRLQASGDPLALGVYTGSSGSLVEVAYNQRSPVDNDWVNAQVQFTPTAGTTYYIGVGSDPKVTFTLYWAPSARPANNNFADATSLPADATGSTIEATPEAGDPTFHGNADLGGRSVWYTYTATETTAVDISLEGSSYYPRLGVYTGSLGSLSEVAYGDSWTAHPAEVSFIAQAATTYHIGIGGGAANDYVLDGGQTITWGDSGSYVLHAATAPASAPGVTLDPVSQTVNAGQSVTFTAAATGAPTPTVQWQVSTDGGSAFNDIVGATSATLSFTADNGHNGNQYRAVFTNGAGSATSNAATLTVNWAPTVMTHPVSQTVNAGGTATFTAAAGGNPEPTVQWQVSIDSGSTWNDMSGETSTTLDFTAPATDNGKQYHAVFTNVVGSTTSNAATLTVNVAPSAPTITTQPTDQAVAVGATATFTAAASGNPTPTVQWQVSTTGGKKWTNVSGATDPTLTLTSVTLAQNGYKYRAVFTNSQGSAITNAATLTVTSGDAGVSITYTSHVYDSTAKTVTWVLSVSNSGPNAAQAVQVVDTLAKGTKLVSVSVEGATGWTSKTQGSKVTVSLGTLNKDGSATITIVTQLGRTPLPVTNSATVTTTSNDADTTNNSDTDTVNG